MEAQLQTVETGIEVYKPFREELAKAKEMNDRAVFQYEDPKGNKAARSHIYGLRKIRAAIEKARKSAKAEALEYGRRVDGEAKELHAQLDAMIAVHETPLLEIETREKERVAAIRAKIEEIDEFREIGSQNPASSIKESLEALQGIAVDSTFAEFMAGATEIHAAAVAHLESALAVAEKREAEEAELERLRKEKEERERKEREEAIAREAAERARREAEARAEKARIAAEAKAREERERLEREKAEAEAAARREKEESERREREAEEARQRAEREREEAEARAKRAAQEERARIVREAAAKAKAEADAKARREANKRHRAKVLSEVADDIGDTLPASCDDRALSSADIAALVDAIAEGKIRHTTINF